MAGASMTYPFGIDVSSYQKRMDWQRAISTGATFARLTALGIPVDRRMLNKIKTQNKK
jgi:GH25 family lysozyme M1 (1,4-beta-N-acetylmuramidase)